MNTIDVTFTAHRSGAVRTALHRARRSLAAKRNGVVTWISAAPSAKGLEVHARNTRADGINVSRKFKIGPRGGLFMDRPNYRRYFKAAQFGKGSL